MAKNKILGWMSTIQGIKDFAEIAWYSFRKTSIDALKTLPENKAILGKPKDVQSSGKDIGLKVIHNLRLPEFSKMTEGPQKSDLTFNGLFSKTLKPKPGSKQ